MSNRKNQLRQVLENIQNLEYEISLLQSELCEFQAGSPTGAELFDQLVLKLAEVAILKDLNGLNVCH